MDFFTIEVWTACGLVTYYILFVIDLKSRKVRLAGATPNPGESFMAQVARNLTDAVDGFLTGHRFLICDRDSKFSAQFTQILKAAAKHLQISSICIHRFMSGFTSSNTASIASTRSGPVERFTSVSFIG